MTFLVGIFHHRIAHATRITLDEEGVEARTSPVRKFHLLWDEIQSIEVDDAAIRFLTKNGEQRVKLNNLTNGQDVEERFCDYLRSNDIEVNRLESGRSRRQDVAVKAL
jgi:FMN phosphatase YigB (HAD superfamily)